MGDLTFGIYRLVLFGVALMLIGLIWTLFTYTRFGARARATMENPEMAEAFGINTSRMYALTFGLGSALGGIAGGMFALSATISPFFGVNYTLFAFITVVVGGGANVITGVTTSAAALAGAQTIMNNAWRRVCRLRLHDAGGVPHFADPSTGHLGVSGKAQDTRSEKKWLATIRVASSTNTSVG